MNGQAARILVIEDRAVDRELVERVLRGEGHAVVTADNGETAQQLFQAAVPDVVLCDVRLPGISGLDFCQWVKGQAAAGFVPVLLVTAAGEREDLLRGLAAGADDYIVKPLDFAELKARVRIMLRIRRAEMALRERSASLELAHREMETLLRAVSHDLRTPLVSMGGICDRMLRDHAPPDRDSIAALREQVGYLAALVNSLVDLARIDRAPLKRRQVAARDMLDQALDNLAEPIHQRGAAIAVEGEWGTVHADPLALCQIFQNLVGNAVKFMGNQTAPRVAIRTSHENGAVAFSVADNGIGIPDDQIASLFQPFRRLEQVATDGLGIGLSIVEKNVRRHGGRVSIESLPGAGTTVHFTIPDQEQL